MRPAVDPTEWAQKRRTQMEQARQAAAERKENQSLSERLQEIAREEERAVRRRGFARVDVPLGAPGVMHNGVHDEVPCLPSRHEVPCLPSRPPADPVLLGCDAEGEGERDRDTLQAARQAAYAERERLRKEHGNAKRVMLGFGGNIADEPPVEERPAPGPRGIKERLEQRAAERAAAPPTAPQREMQPLKASRKEARDQGRGRPRRGDPNAPCGEIPVLSEKENRAPLVKKAEKVAPQPPQPQPKPKPVAKRALGASSCVDHVAALAKAREERRARQAKQRQEHEEAVAASGGNLNAAQFRRMVEDFRRRYRPSEDLPPPGCGMGELTVCVRKRPLSQREEAAGALDCATCGIGHELVFHEPRQKFDLSRSLENHPFYFDHVFDAGASNAHVYNSVLAPFLERGLRGGLTVFAYGQTGSGKTFTMRALCSSAVGALVSGAVAGGLHASVSAFEIYMNKVHDLLANRAEVRMLEDGGHELQVVGLTERPVACVGDVEVAMAETERVRTTAANAVHSDSSRSHAVVQLTLRSPSGRLHARLSLVDLAGSERAAETQTDGQATRLEGAEINKSLLALKECIRAAGRNAEHVPYRGSLLTRALRGCFEGGCSRWRHHTVVIATISPALANADHSLNTLRYAARLKELRKA